MYADAEAVVKIAQALVHRSGVIRFKNVLFNSLLLLKLL